MTSSSERKVESLAILSGKGGSGKTVIALAMASVLAEAGAKVVLVDCDTGTHGASYFFEDELERTSGRIASVSDDLFDEASPEAQPLKSKRGFSFIPSTLNVMDTPVIADIGKQQADKYWERLTQSFEVIILDCQSGYSPVTEWAVEKAEGKLLVLEPDTVSQSALRVLWTRLFVHLKSYNTWQIFNKLTEEERPIYEKIPVGGALFPNLPPIPFDWEVRAAFAVREIPNVLSTGSAFGLAVLRIMSKLFPSFADRVRELEKRAVGDWYEDIRSKLEKLQILRNDVMFKKVERVRRLRIQRIRVASIALAGVGVVSLALSFVGFRAAPGFLGRPEVLFAASGVLAVTLSFLWLLLGAREVGLEVEQDIAQQNIEKTEGEVQRYRTLIASDPRLREYERRSET